MPALQVNDRVVLDCADEGTLGGVITDIRLDDDTYVTITLIDAHGVEHTIASGGHFGDSLYLEGAVECFVHCVR